MTSTPIGQGEGDDYFDINKFEQLLNRLEASKGRQQRQKSLEGRRDIFATGLGSMMSNFQQMEIPKEKDGLDQGFSLDGFTGLLNRLRESKDRQVEKSKITGQPTSTPSLNSLS